MAITCELRMRSAQQVVKVWVAAVIGPAGGCGVDLGVLYVSIGAVVQEELDHRAMPVERCVMESRAGVIEAARDRIDLGAFVQ